MGPAQREHGDRSDGTDPGKDGKPHPGASSLRWIAFERRDERVALMRIGRQPAHHSVMQPPEYVAPRWRRGDLAAHLTLGQGDESSLAGSLAR
ncbi:MAG: hypothetical protein MJE77_10385 [Proteobacteria bacterium]|nr:hypothetical protein [Pseudomonadota bacterium]